MKLPPLDMNNKNINRVLPSYKKKSIPEINISNDIESNYTQSKNETNSDNIDNDLEENNHIAVDKIKEEEDNEEDKED